MPFCRLIPVLYCTIWGDHRSRGWYDDLWSVLRPGHVGPMYAKCAMDIYRWCAAVVIIVSPFGEPRAVCL